MLSMAVYSHAQTIGQNKAPGAEETYTLSVLSQLVVETVVVKDKPINGLTAQDFTLTEDGVPQKIRFCEQQTLPTKPLPLVPQRAAMKTSRSTSAFRARC